MGVIPLLRNLNETQTCDVQWSFTMLPIRRMHFIINKLNQLWCMRLTCNLY